MIAGIGIPVGKVVNLTAEARKQRAYHEKKRLPENLVKAKEVLAEKQEVRKEFIYGSEEERKRRLDLVRAGYLDGGRITNLCQEHRVPRDIGLAYCKRPSIKEQVLKRVRGRKGIWKFNLQIFSLHKDGMSNERIAEMLLCKERDIAMVLKRLQRLNPELNILSVADHKKKLVGKALNAMEKALDLSSLGDPDAEGNVPLIDQSDINAAKLGAAKIGFAITKETGVLVPKRLADPISRAQQVNVFAQMTDEQLHAAMRELAGDQPKQIEATAETVEP